MPHIFDNINEKLLPQLKESLKDAFMADFCVGYFNLRGWKLIQEEIEQFTGGENNCCRLLIGMQKLPKDELNQMLGLGISRKPISQNDTINLKKRFSPMWPHSTMTSDICICICVFRNREIK